jgi:hypothetical protein
MNRTQELKWKSMRRLPRKRPVVFVNRKREASRKACR